MSIIHSNEVILKFKEHNTIANWRGQMTWKEIFVVEDSDESHTTGALVNW